MLSVLSGGGSGVGASHLSGVVCSGGLRSETLRQGSLVMGGEFVVWLVLIAALLYFAATGGFKR